jgi:hypothetical protein
MNLNTTTGATEADMHQITLFRQSSIYNRIGFDSAQRRQKTSRNSTSGSF